MALIAYDPRTGRGNADFTLRCQFGCRGWSLLGRFGDERPSPRKLWGAV